MFFAYTTIGQAIQKAVKDIRWIDLDKGQLENAELFNSIITPGILIGNSEIEWSSTGSGHSIGDGTVTVKLVLHLPTETHLANPLLSENLKKLELAEEVETAVLSVPGISSLIKSSDYPSGPYYVAEQIYQVSFQKAPSYVQKKVQVKVNPFLYNPNQANA